LTGRKLVEEATETLIAAKNHTAGDETGQRIVEESADVVYHLLALLAEREIPAAEVLAELRKRAR
ncbi:MAG: phosphoribosyl-ATP diphosphatase, partial [Acidimicrobiia bacterium]|nr:phosphoribosyl-ATP diphosphatase [Acidimicrobiia bacterium]